MSVRKRGGQKKADKKKGRGHWKGRSAQRAAEMVNGMINNSRGVVQENSRSDCPSGKTILYYQRQAERAMERQARNQAARRKRGCRNGHTLKPVGPTGYTAGTYHA